MGRKGRRGIGGKAGIGSDGNVASIGGGGAAGAVATQAIVAPTSVIGGGVYADFATALTAVTADDEIRATLIAHELEVDLSNIVQGSHDGGDAAAAFSDSTQTWTVDDYVGFVIWNQSAGSFGVITANTATGITAVMWGGSRQTFNNGDGCAITPGTVVLPGAGTHDLLGISFGGTLRTLSTFNFSGGAQAESIKEIMHNATVRCLQTVPAIVASGAPFGESITIRGTIVGGHAAPVIAVLDGYSWEVHAFGDAIIGDGVNPAITQAVAGELVIHLHDRAKIASGALEGDDGDKVIVKTYGGEWGDDGGHSFTAGAVTYERQDNLALFGNDTAAAGTVPIAQGDNTFVYGVPSVPSVPDASVEVPIINGVPGTLAFGTVVKCEGYDGVNYGVTVLNTSSSTAPFFGIVKTPASDTVPGVAVISGILDGYDCSALATFDLLYSDATLLTATPPAYPDNHQPVAMVTEGGNASGALLILGGRKSGEDNGTETLPQLATDTLWTGAANRTAAEAISDFLKRQHAYLHLDTGVGAPAGHVAGRVYWDTVELTAALQTSITGVTLQIGQELFVLVYNATASPIANGKVVGVTGATGGYPTVDLAIASDPAVADATLGVATHNIAASSFGFITTFGAVRDINSTGSGHAAGDQVYLSAAATGEWTKVRPTHPDRTVSVGTILTVDATVGKILVRIHVAAHEIHAIPVSSSDPGNVLTDVLGHRTLLESAQTVSDVAPHTIATDIFNSQLVFEITALPSGSLTARLTGRSIDESTGTETAGDTEDILVSATGWYAPAKKWLGSVEISVVTASRSMTTNISDTRYWDNGDIPFTIVGVRWGFLPSNANWDFSWWIYKHNADGSQTLLQSGVFDSGDARPRAGSGRKGTDKLLNLTDYIDAGNNEGIVIVTDSNALRFMYGEIKYQNR